MYDQDKITKEGGRIGGHEFDIGDPRHGLQRRTEKGPGRPADRGGDPRGGAAGAARADARRSAAGSLPHRLSRGGRRL